MRVKRWILSVSVIFLLMSLSFFPASARETDHAPFTKYSSSVSFPVNDEDESASTAESASSEVEEINITQNEANSGGIYMNLLLLGIGGFIVFSILAAVKASKSHNENEAKAGIKSIASEKTSDTIKQDQKDQTERKGSRREGHPFLTFGIFIVILFFVCCIMAGLSNTATQEKYQQGLDEGYASGFDDGYNEGYDSGHSDGYDLGYQNGEDSGYDTGYSDGRSDAFEYINEWLYNHYGDGADEYYSQTVYVTDTGDKYHREGCSYLLSSNPITLRQAINRGYTPCSRCNPPD